MTRRRIMFLALASVGAAILAYILSAYAASQKFIASHVSSAQPTKCEPSSQAAADPDSTKFVSCSGFS